MCSESAPPKSTPSAPFRGESVPRAPSATRACSLYFLVGPIRSTFSAARRSLGARAQRVAGGLSDSLELQRLAQPSSDSLSPPATRWGPKLGKRALQRLAERAPRPLRLARQLGARATPEPSSDAGALAERLGAVSLGSSDSLARPPRIRVAVVCRPSPPAPSPPHWRTRMMVSTRLGGSSEGGVWG